MEKLFGSKDVVIIVIIQKFLPYLFLGERTLRGLYIAGYCY